MKDWVVNIRFLAILFVVLLHISASVSVEILTVSKFNWIVSIFYNSLSRCCVPLFLMLTGALILPKREHLLFYLRKRSFRIIGPWFFYTFLFTSLTLYAYSRRNEVLSFDIILRIILDSLLNGASYHFWYIYMLFGLILIIPLIKGWLHSANNIEIIYFLSIWFFTIFLEWLGVNLEKYHIFYFSRYIGYLVLGHVISNTSIFFKINSKVVFIIFLFSFLSTFLLTVYYSFKIGTFSELFFEYLSPNVLIYSASLFFLIRNNFFMFPIWLNYYIKLVSDSSFGIYFIHVLVLYFVFKFFDPLDFNILFSIPLLTLIILFISFSMIKLMRYVPYFKYFIG